MEFSEPCKNFSQKLGRPLKIWKEVEKQKYSTEKRLLLKSLTGM